MALNELVLQIQHIDKFKMAEKQRELSKMRRQVMRDLRDREMLQAARDTAQKLLKREQKWNQVVVPQKPVVQKGFSSSQKKTQAQIKLENKLKQNSRESQEVLDFYNDNTEQ